MISEIIWVKGAKKCQHP